MAQNTSNKVPPLVDLKVNNPVTYIKLWWKKVIDNEGVYFSFRVRPLTAIVVALAIASVGFGVGRFVMPFSIPFFKYEQVPTPTPKPDDWKQTAFTGTLQYSSATSKYFLTTTSASEAISLQVPNNIDLQTSIGKRILVIGSYNRSERLFIVSDAKDLEILPKNPVPIPTNPPTPTPTQAPTETPSPSPTEMPSPSPQ